LRLAAWLLLAVFGFDELSVEAKRLETQLRELIAARTAPQLALIDESLLI
jgi:hypothetical protein